MSELTKVQTKIRSKFTQVRNGLRSEDFFKNNVSSFSFMHKFLNTLKNIDIEINVFFKIISMLLFHGYSKDIFSITFG